MNKEIENIEKDVEKHCKKTLQFDEHLFNLGVQLGRTLEKNGLAEHRLNVFVEHEKNTNKTLAKLTQTRRIDKLIEMLIRNAIAQHVESGSEFVFDEFQSTKLSQEIANKFHVQSSKTVHADESSFELEFNILGDVAEIFEKYGVEKTAKTTISNTSGDSYETIYEADDVSEIFATSTKINAHSTNLSEKELADFAEELEKIIVVISLSLHKVR